MASTKRVVVAALWLLALITWGNILTAFWGVPNLGLVAGVLVAAAVATAVPHRLRDAVKHAARPATIPAITDHTAAR